LFGFGKKKNDAPETIKSVGDIKKLLQSEGQDAADKIISFADSGNLVCQQFLAQMSLMALSDGRLKNDPINYQSVSARYENYATMVAENGDAGEQFNLALFYVRKLNIDDDYFDDDDIENMRLAAKWMRAAADQGIEKAQESVDHLEAMYDNHKDADYIGYDDDYAEQDNDQTGTGNDYAEHFDRKQKFFNQTVNMLFPTDFSDIEGLIRRLGFDEAIRFYAHLIRLRIPDSRVRWQFILEEMDSARQGNAESQAFARQSGIPESEYVGALDRSFIEVDGPEGPQQLLLQLCMQMRKNMELVVEFRTSVVQRIMDDHDLATA
jgi:hypothetical protein